MSTYILVGIVAMLAGAALLARSRRSRRPAPRPTTDDELRPTPMASLPPTPGRDRIRTGVLSPRDFRSDDELEAAGDALVESRREEGG